MLAKQVVESEKYKHLLLNGSLELIVTSNCYRYMQGLQLH